MFELKTIFNYLYSLVTEEPKRVFIIVENNFVFMHRIVKEKLHIDARSLPIEEQSLTTFVRDDFRVYFCHSEYFSKEDIECIISAANTLDLNLPKFIYIASTKKTPSFMKQTSLRKLIAFGTKSWIVENVDGNVLIVKRVHNRQQLPVNSSENQSSSRVPSMEETFVTADDLKPEATVPDNKDALVTVETQNTPEALTTGKEHHPDRTIMSEVTLHTSRDS